MFARCLTLLLALSLSGCALTPEQTWQAIHLIDTGQTLHIARAPECYYENAPLTRAIIGKHPNEAEVAAIMITYSLLHDYISDRLRERENLAWLRAFQVVTILNSGRNVIHNHQIGLRPFGSGC